MTHSFRSYPFGDAMDKIKQFVKTMSPLDWLVGTWTLSLILSVLLVCVAAYTHTGAAKKLEEKEEACRSLCLPNGYRGLHGNQCMCEVSIVVKPLPAETK